MTEFIEYALNNSFIIIVSIFYIVSSVIFLTLCVCCRKNSQKNDLLGVDGNLKIKNPDENVNHLPSVGKYISSNKDEFFTEFDENKRPTSGSNPHRSLPDIPVYLDGENGASGDTCSDLYATVDDKKVPNGLNQHSRDNLSDYAGVKENPYDRLKKENPYAKVQSVEASRSSSQEELAVPGCSTDQIEGLETNDGEIHAAVAVAGRVAASVDLPYMTPPIENSNVEQGDISVEVPQQHFSGDSQDSSKGYTSISVREPLEHIRKQTTTVRPQKQPLDSDPHYATVSDDSDDNMYAAIVEPPTESQLYNSGSETYAQIQPITVVEIHGIQNQNPGNSNHQNDLSNESRNQIEEASELPNVQANIKHVNVHSRQASSSSCTSSIANIGSPKPEKRQANSPLPPTPAISSQDVYSIVDKSNSNHKRTASSGAARNLEDMYAKVQKNNKKTKNSNEIDEICTLVNDQRSQTPDFHQKVKLENRQSWSSRDSREENLKNFNENSNSDIEFEHCYETLNKNKNKKLTPKKSDVSDIGYEKIKNSSGDPGYELLSHSRISCETDPNYEILRPKEENEHGYSSLKKSEIPTYSVVNKKPKTHGYEEIHVSNQNQNQNQKKNSQNFDQDFEKEPGYEIDSKKLQDPGYQEIGESSKNQKSPLKQDTKTDPNYEELSKIENFEPSEPNYESMPYIKNQKSSESDFSEPNYESVKYLDVNLELGEPPYEKLNDSISDKSFDLEANTSNSQKSQSQNGSQNIPGYEKLRSLTSDSSFSENGEKIEELIEKNTDENLYIQI